MKVYGLIIACVVCNVSAQLFLKNGASGSSLYQHGHDMARWVSVLFSPSVLGGIALWTISTLIWIYLLSGVELSFAYALYGLNYVFTPLAARWFFQEQVNSMQLAGIAFITLGVGLTISGRISS